MVTMKTRQNDFEHYVKCSCGWQGYAADMSHSYDGGWDGEAYPVDYCPGCGASEESEAITMVLEELNNG